MLLLSLSVVILALAASFEAAATGSNSCEKSTSFDVALLATQYAPGVCSKEQCGSYGNEFTIHGMWPNYSDNTWPEYCCYEIYLQKSILSPILSKMEKYWRSLYTDNTNWGFWIHEWKKHGTCTEKSKLKGQFNYFNTTITLFEQLKLTTWLGSAGIKPGLSDVKVETIREAIRSGFGKRPQIGCLRINGQSVLSEVNLCYDPESLKPTDCPAARESCRSKVSVPAA